MSISRKNFIRMDRKKKRVRRSIQNASFGRLRISVFRSINHIYAQVIDDVAQRTVASCSSVQMTQVVGKKRQVAFEIGKELARRLLDVNQEYAQKVVFDRGQYEYHGRVAEVAAGLREGGLNF